MNLCHCCSMSLDFSHVPQEVFSVDLNKPMGGSLGLSLTYRAIDSDIYPFVKSLAPNGVAQKSGKINVGDRIVMVSELILCLCLLLLCFLEFTCE